MHETEDPSALLHLVRPPEAGALSVAGKYLQIGIVLYGMALCIGLPKKTGFVAMFYIPLEYKRVLVPQGTPSRLRTRL